MEATELRAALRDFTGTTNHYVHWTGLRFTDGVKYLTDTAGAYWLLDVIGSWQTEALRDPWLREFQLWELFVYPGGMAAVVCSRDSEDEAFRQAIPSTDFPLEYVKLYVENGVVLLPSEH